MEKISDLIPKLKVSAEAKVTADMTKIIEARLIESFQTSSTISSSRKYLKHGEKIHEANKLMITHKYDEIRHEAKEIVKSIAYNDSLLIEEGNFQDAKASDLLGPLTSLDTYFDSDHYILFFSKLISSAFDSTKNVRPIYSTLISNLTRNDALLLTDLFNYFKTNHPIIVKPVIVISEDDVANVVKEDFVINLSSLDGLLSSDMTETEISESLSSLIEMGIMKIEEKVPYGFVAPVDITRTDLITDFNFFFSSTTYKELEERTDTDYAIYCTPIKVIFTPIGYSFCNLVCQDDIPEYLQK